MMAEFDYDAPNVPDSAVTDVAADIASSGKAPPLTPEQIEQRKIDAQLHALACLQRDEEFRLQWERKKSQEAAEARAKAAIAQAEVARKARLEREERIERESRQRELRDLQFKVTQQDWWQKNVDRAANNAVRRQQILATMGEIDQLINPPSPEPEPEPEEVYDPYAEVRRGWEECSRRYQREQELKQLKSK